jgi:hypothetical protein
MSHAAVEVPALKRFTFVSTQNSRLVMAGLVPAISLSKHGCPSLIEIAGTSPAVTKESESN